MNFILSDFQFKTLPHFYHLYFPPEVSYLKRDY